MAINLPYILVDEFGLKDANGVLTGGLLKKVWDALNTPPGAFPFLNYQYGYFDELTETLQQYSKTPQFIVKKFPLVWVEQPFTVDREAPQLYGETIDLRIFIIHESVKQKKAEKRMTDIFKPTLYPIYIELLNQIQRWSSFDNSYFVKHRVRDYYFWEEENNFGKPVRSMLNDVVDCIQLSNVRIKIKNKCVPGLT